MLVSKDKVIDEVNSLLKNAATKRLDSEADKDMRFWLEVAPYLSVLGLSMPKNPSSILSLPTLMEGLLSNNLQKKSNSLAEDLQSTVARKAFSAHQIIGILKKYNHIDAESCASFREQIFTTATKINHAIETNKVKIDGMDKTSKKIKKWGVDLLKEYGIMMMEEAADEPELDDSILPSLGKLVEVAATKVPDCDWVVMDSPLGKISVEKLRALDRSAYIMGEHGLSYYDKLTGHLQKIKLDKTSLMELTSEFKGLSHIKHLSVGQIKKIMSITHQIPASNIGLYDCLRTLYNAKKLRDSLENKHKFDDKKCAAYDERIKEYIAEEKKFENIQKLGGLFARLENEEEILGQKVNAVAHDDLGLDWKSKVLKKINKAGSDFSTYIDTTFSKSISELKAMEDTVGHLQEQHHQALRQLLTMDDKDINIKSLTDFQAEFKVDEVLQQLQQVQQDIKELRDVTVKGRDDAIDYEKFYKRVDLVLKKAEKLEGSFEKINDRVGEIKNDLLKLHEDIAKYNQKTVHSKTRQIARALVKNPEGSGKTKSEKTEAATILDKMVVGEPEARPISPSFGRATSEGKLGALAKNFKSYKDRFKEAAKDMNNVENISPASKSK